MAVVSLVSLERREAGRTNMNIYSATQRCPLPSPASSSVQTFIQNHNPRSRFMPFGEVNKFNVHLFKVKHYLGNALIFQKLNILLEKVKIRGQKLTNVTFAFTHTCTPLVFLNY